MGVSALMEEDQEDKHEEFQEFEVLFPETTPQHRKKINGSTDRTSNSSLRTSNGNTVDHNQNQKKMEKMENSVSVPVRIPGGFRENPCLKRYEFDEILEFEDEMEMVPPHLILDRRASSRRMAFSVCTGNGRTLKGRDLCRVRNSVLRMTGFIETC